MSSSSTINVHLKGEKAKVPLRKITPQSSKAKYNAPLEGRKSLENVASTHRTNNLRNSVSSSKVPIRLESRTGGCSKSNSEVMINENSNKSKGNSKRKIIDHLNSRESHPHGEDKVNAHLSEKKPSKLKRNSAFQINITENISHPCHSRSSSSKEGNEHKKCHGQGRTEAKKMLPCRSILKKFSQSDLHLNNPNLNSTKRKLNFSFRKITNRDEKQSDLRKVTFKACSTTDLTQSSNSSKKFPFLRKSNEGKLIKQRCNDIEIESGDHLLHNKPNNIILDTLVDNSTDENNHNALSNISEVLKVDIRKSNSKENETNMNDLEVNKNTNDEIKFDILMAENIFEVPADIKFPSGNSPNIIKTPVLKADSLHTDNKDHSKSAIRRKVIEKEINAKIKFLTEQYKKNIKYNQRPISRSDENYQKMDKCGDYKIDEPCRNSSSTFKSSENLFSISKTKVDELNIEDSCNTKKFGRKQLLENEVNEKIKIIVAKFKENESKKTFSDVVVNESENLKLTEIKSCENKQVILNSVPCSKDVELNCNQPIRIEGNKSKIHNEFPRNLANSEFVTENIINFNCDEYNTSQADFESSFKSQTSIDEVRLPQFSRIPRLLRCKTGCSSPLLNGQSNVGACEKITNDIFLNFSKQNETINIEQNELKTALFKDINFEKRNPFISHTKPISKELTKSPRCSLIPRPLASKTGMDSPLSGDFKSDTLRKRTVSSSPTSEIFDASKMESSPSILEYELCKEHPWTENKLDNFNEKSFTVEEFDNLTKDKENIEHFNNSILSNLCKITLKKREQKTRNKKDEGNKHDIFSSKCEENCDENYLNTLQVGKSYCDIEVAMSYVRYSFSRHFKLLFLIGLIVLFFVLLFNVLYSV